MKLRPLLIATTLALHSLISAEESGELIVNLKDPEYVGGVAKTEEGGVITAPNLRIQAKTIIYTDTKDEQSIFAEGDIMMEYHGRFFVGKELKFDIKTKTGYLIAGKVNIDSWFIGGDRVELASDGSFMIYGAFITTCVGEPNTWEIKANRAHVEDGHILQARDVRFQIMNTPVLWLPSYKSNLKKFKDPPIRYRLVWDKGLGPRFSARYRIYANETFSAFARFDLRFKYLFNKEKDFALGPGGAIEAEYLSKDKLSHFQTRNYGALDKIFPDENGDTRFRFQGIYKTSSKDKYSKFHIQWDRMSDNRMVSDFKEADFEVNTQKMTYLQASHYQDLGFASLSVRPKINAFDSLAQELPYGVVGLRPLEVGKSGIILENYASGSYLDYTFANQLDKLLKNRKAGRLETLNTAYRPFSLAGFTATPFIGVVGIYYSQSPEHNAVGQFTYKYGGDLDTRFSKQYDTIKHTVQPYAQYLGYAKPRVQVDDYFVFDIHDGYDQLDQLRFGLRQLFFSKSNSIFLPALTLDLYSYAFWGAKSFTQVIPKAFADLKINQSNYAIFGGLGWNIQENLLDYGNIRFLWTVNADIALGVEFLHRSRFWWRKAIHDNYTMDFARPVDELLDSPLSDGRNTLLTKAHFRLTPRWNMQLQTHHGWGRANEPRYNGAKIDFYTMLTGNWQMKLTYEYAPNDPYRFSYSFKLIK